LSAKPLLETVKLFPPELASSSLGAVEGSVWTLATRAAKVYRKVAGTGTEEEQEQAQEQEREQGQEMEEEQGNVRLNANAKALYRPHL
jgi:hypothetical protein